MTFRVEIAPAAQRNIRRISSQLREPIEAAIYRLADDPHPRGSIKLRGRERTWRVRAGQFRIIYEVHSDMLLVLILKVASRNEATYR
jgi:mRNA interferase RelE/StbE